MGVRDVERGVRAVTTGHAGRELRKEGASPGALQGCVHFWLLRIFQLLAP
jgi:hypothetical protein